MSTQLIAKRLQKLLLISALVSVSFQFLAHSSTSSNQIHDSNLREALVAKLAKAPYYIPSSEISSFSLMQLKELQQQHYLSLTLNNQAR